MEIKVNLFLLDEYVLVLKTNGCDEWKILSLDGEDKLAHNQNIENISNVLEQINARINRQSKLAEVQFTLVYTSNCVQWLPKVVSLIVNEYQCNYFELQHWQSLMSIADISDVMVSQNESMELLIEKLVPLLNTSNKILELQKEIDVFKQSLDNLTVNNELNVANQEPNNKDSYQEVSIESISEEKLLKEISFLRSQLANTEPQSLEVLVSYLPSIFKDFWNVVPPAELALLADTLQPPNIASPYRSPSKQAVLTKKRKFLSLDDVSKNRIISFCYLLREQYSLVIHPEFKSIIGEG